jgi:3-oxosteroid 1-dehydrogenase
LLAGSPYSIILNKQGRRCANDAFYPHVVEQVTRYDGQMTSTPNWPAWLVFDQSMLDKDGQAPSVPGQPFPEDFAI